MTVFRPDSLMPLGGVQSYSAPVASAVKTSDRLPTGGKENDGRISFRQLWVATRFTDGCILYAAALENNLHHHAASSQARLGSPGRPHDSSS